MIRPKSLSSTGAFQISSHDSAIHSFESSRIFSFTPLEPIAEKGEFTRLATLHMPGDDLSCFERVLRKHCLLIDAFCQFPMIL
jgi:hypothetical protein